MDEPAPHRLSSVTSWILWQITSSTPTPISKVWFDLMPRFLLNTKDGLKMGPNTIEMPLGPTSQGVC